MGYAKTWQPDTISVSDTQVLASCGVGDYFPPGGLPYVKLLEFTMSREISQSRIMFSIDAMATAPDEVWWSYRINGSSLVGGNWQGAWTTSQVTALLPGLSPGDTIELWAYGTTGATAALRNWKIYGVMSPFFASV